MINYILSVDLRMLHASGIGTYLYNIIPFIVTECPNVNFKFLGNAQKMSQYNWSHQESLIIIDLRSPVYSIPEQFELIGKIPGGTALFWSPHYNIPLLPIRAKKRIVTIHDIFHLAFFNKLNLKEKVYAKVMINAAVRLSDKIITVSNFSKSEIIKHTNINETKIEVIYNGINKENYKVIEKFSTLAAIKSKYNLPEKFILYVGNVKPHKNLVRLLKAFDKFTQSYSEDCNIVIAGQKEGFITGDREIFEMLENKANLKRKTFFTGYVENEDLPALYNLALLFVFPSLHEGFGLPPLEAMACGCPVVVSNAASLPEVCGDAAYYVDPYSVESIAEGIHKVLSDNELWQNLITKGLERARLFSWGKSAREHIKVFEEVLNS